METLKLEDVDDFYGHILARAKLIRKQEFEENKPRLIRETHKLPKSFQHRIAFMRQYTYRRESNLRQKRLSIFLN